MEELLSRRLPVFVGRGMEQSLISKTVAGDGRPVVLIMGGAGIGKTCLLEEVERIVEEINGKGGNILCLPILDFYDTSIHSESAIEEAIYRNLVEHGIDHAFDEFREKLIECREGRISEKQVWEAFKAGYDKICHDRRIVLRFDTAEILEYEHDDPAVLEDCDISGLEAPSLGWLAEKAPQLQNTAIFIASRPNEELRKRLEGAYGSTLELIELEELTLGETRSYFQEAGDFGREVLASSPEMAEKIWLLSGGRPIFISLSLDWLWRGMWDEKVYAVDVAALRGIQKQGGEEWEDIKRSFRIALVQKFREIDSSLDKAAYYAARARKGCNAKLLARMMGVSDQEAGKLASQLMGLSFVKQPHMLPTWRETWFFLHDEMYDLMEEHVWQATWPAYQEQERVASEIIGYYDDEIRKVEEGVRKARTERERSDLQYRRRVLLAERLYYQFDLDPRQGLTDYDCLDTQACSEKAWEWDNLLRIEALRFARQRAERARYGGWVTIQDGKPEIADWVNMDCRARWVHRYIARGEHEKAIEVAGKLLSKYPWASGLWKARLLVSRAAAEERLGWLGENWLFDEAESDIDEALRLLDEIVLDEFNEWIVNHYKATALVYRGLVARALGELEKASQSYADATLWHRETGYQPGEARALNNRAFILARQGRQWEALDACQEALRMRQEAGDEYGVSLSLNTLGIIKGTAGDYPGALTESLKAMRLFQRRRDETGIALARINLGWAYRRLGSSDMRRNPVDIEKYFQLSAESLLQAQGAEHRLEPYYRVQLHNELGCTYKDWANFLTLHGADQSRYYELMGNADEEFRMADDIAGIALKLEKADNLEDWAWVYHLRYAYREKMKEETPQALFRQAEEKLDAAEANLEDFKRRVEQGLEGHLYLGKIHYQRAHLMKFQEDWEAVARNYALAATYLETYSSEATELKQLLFAIESWLGRFPEDQTRALTGVMKEVLNEKESAGWRCVALRGWLDDVILAAPTFGLGR